jgi:hypothetical protein
MPHLKTKQNKKIQTSKKLLPTDLKQPTIQASNLQE